MPAPYLAAHALLFLGSLGCGAWLRRRSPRATAVSGGLLLCLGLPVQLFVLSQPRLLAALVPWPDLFFFHDLLVHFAGFLAGAALAGAEGRGGRARAAALSLAILACAGVEARRVALAPPPVPAPSGGQEPARLRPGEPFVLRQSQPATCAPAAAATLLRALGLAPQATEAGLARLCFTDPLRGTHDLGLFRGLSLSAPTHRVRFARLLLDDLLARRRPCLVFVGLSRARAKDERLFAYLRDRCNWREDEVHAVVFFGTEPSPGTAPNGPPRVVIGDPNYGVERWGLDHFSVLWDGWALLVDP
ncbi:MAG: hypothetical protein D6731_05250 [Planctomycetota bacterium]|nr:MAG: hypothetical protein D6731_05250 [Planctomycetota bacterium]